MRCIVYTTRPHFTPSEVWFASESVAQRPRNEATALRCGYVRVSCHGRIVCGLELGLGMEIEIGESRVSNFYFDFDFEFARSLWEFLVQARALDLDLQS